MTLAQSIVQILGLMLDLLKIIWHNFVQFCDYIKINEYIVPFCIKLFIVTLIGSIIYSITFMVRQWIKTTCQTADIKQENYNRIQKGAYYTIVLIGSMILLQNIGIQLTPIITLLGIIGVALGYALKDFVANIIAGILLITYPPFKINDYIKIKDWQGKVIDINIRVTTLQEGNTTVFVPNSILFTSTFAIIKSVE